MLKPTLTSENDWNRTAWVAPGAATDDADDRAVAWRPGAIGRLLSMTPPRLYYMPRTRSSRVLWLLEEIGAPYDLTRSGPRSGGLRSTCCATRWGVSRRCNSATARRCSSPLRFASSWPMHQWVVFAVSELEGPLFRWIREVGEGVIDSPAHDRFADAAAAMQSVLAERDWLVDDRFSVADVMCASVLQGASARDCWDRGRHSRPTYSAARHARRTHGRPPSRIAPAADTAGSTGAGLPSAPQTRHDVDALAATQRDRSRTAPATSSSSAGLVAPSRSRAARRRQVGPNRRLGRRG